MVVGMAGMRKAYNLAAASVVGNLDTVQRLLASPGIQVDFDGRFTPALIQAASNGHVDIVKVLIAAGADVNREYNETTPLIAAAKKGHLAVIQALIASNADVNQCAYINTPLSTAAAYGHTRIVETLLKAGANVTRPDQPGFTSLMFDQTRRYPAVLRLFLRYGAVIPNPAEFAAMGNLGAASHAQEVVRNVQTVKNNTRRNKARSVLIQRALNTRTAEAEARAPPAKTQNEEEVETLLSPPSKRRLLNTLKPIPLTLPNALYHEISRKYLGGKSRRLRKRR